MKFGGRKGLEAQGNSQWPQVKDVDMATHREKVFVFPRAFGPFSYTEKPSQKGIVYFL